MGFKGKWVFKCLGCKTKDQDDTEYIDLSKIRSVEEIIHINDLVVSKPDLYVDKPNSVFIEKKLLRDDGRSFAAVKPTIAIPIKNKWPSDISSNESIIEKPKKTKGNKKRNKVVVPISNMRGLLNNEYSKQQLTISESIAIAENIYQNEKKQIMSNGNENEKSKTFKYLDSERLKLNEYKNNNRNKDKKVEEYTFSDDESTSGTISMSKNNINEPQEDQSTHTCYMSEYSDDEQSITEKIWNSFVSVSKFLITKEYIYIDDSKDEKGNRDGKNNNKREEYGINVEGCEDKKWITNNYKLSPKDVSEIVEGTIQNLNKSIV